MYENKNTFADRNQIVILYERNSEIQIVKSYVELAYLRSENRACFQLSRFGMDRQNSLPNSHRRNLAFAKQVFTF